MKTLVEIATEYRRLDDAYSKHMSFYENYEKHLGHMRDQSLNVLEIGVDYGEGIKTLSKYLPNSKFVGVDAKLRDIDISDHSNVKLFECNQIDAAKLGEIVGVEFNNQIDIIIDDASHIGALTARSFDILFPFLKSGGLYIIEDWGTGYWNEWDDGGDWFYPVMMNKRIHSHDFGMVGFVKALVDEVAGPDIKVVENGEVKTVEQRAKSVTHYFGMTIVEKR